MPGTRRRQVRAAVRVRTEVITFKRVTVWVCNPAAECHDFSLRLGMIKRIFGADKSAMEDC
jgi:hypothetical protein